MCLFLIVIIYKKRKQSSRNRELRVKNEELKIKLCYAMSEVVQINKERFPINSSFLILNF